MSLELPVMDHEVIPTGEYPARITDVVKDTGQFGAQLKFVFEIAGGEHKGTQLYYWTPMQLSVGNKLGKLIAATGIEMEPGDKIDVEETVGKVVNATVIISTKKSDGTEFNKLEGVRVYKKKATAKKETVKADDDGDDDDLFINE